MTKTYSVTTCDICGKEIEKNPKTISVMFVTEQNEGTGVEPYIDNVTIDICPECLARYVKYCPIRAYGAQGYNKYEFKEEKI